MPEKLPIPTKCSFCEKEQDLVKSLIGGPQGIAICDSCVALCEEIITAERDVPRPSAGKARGARPAAHAGGSPEPSDARALIQAVVREELTPIAASLEMVTGSLARLTAELGELRAQVAALGEAKN